MMRRIAAGIVGLAALSVGVSASAQSYTRSTSSRTFSSIRFTGTPVTLTDLDEGYGSLSAPFAFSLAGASVSSGALLYVSSNGVLHTDSSIAPYTNVAIPSSSAPNGFAAPFWDDLYFATGGVYYETQGPSGGRVLVIEWSSAGHYSATSDTFSFQVRVYEGTNVVEFHYGTRSALGTWDGTIGIEDSTGFDGVTEFCSPTCRPVDVADGTVISLTPSGSPPGQSDLTITYGQAPPASVQEGAFVSLDFEVYNGGLAASSAGDISLFAGFSPTVTTSDYEIGYTSFGSVASGNYYYGTMSFNVPTGFAGTYYVGLIVDPYGAVSETSETNNTYALGSITVTGGGGGFITITTTSLPAGATGSSYNAQLQQSGAVAPFWWLVSGSLPAGLSLSSNGQISGVPAGDGLYTFRVQAEESGLTPGTADLSINIGAGGSIQITTASLVDAEVGVPYQGKVEAVGGVPPYAFQIISGRPEWLLLDSAGNFSGTPTVQGSHQLTISVFDSNFSDASANLTLNVVEPQALGINAELPPAVSGREYSERLIVGGVPPYQTSVSDGTLPPGLELDGAGYLSGSPTMPGSFTFTVNASDSNSPQGSVQQAVTIEVVALTELQITGTEVSVYVNSDIDQELIAKGGVPPYTWTLLGGALLPGLSLDPAGRLTGRVEMVGNTMVTLMVGDAEGNTAQAEVTVRATLYRSGGGSRGGNGRRGGCTCATSEVKAGAAWIALIGLLLVARVDRRRGHARSATPN
jgi:hypothetical protein